MTPAGSRLVFGSAWIVFLATLAAAEWRSGRHWGSLLVATLLTALAAWELFSMLGVPRMPAGAGCLLLLLGLAALGMSSGARDRFSGFGWILLPGALLLWLRLGRRTGHALPWLFGMLYLSWAGYLIQLRLLHQGGRAGLAEVLLVVAICKGGDMAAYFIGKRFGRRKLAPKISPHKTVEGTVAGLLASVAVAGAASILRPALAGPLAMACLYGAAVGIAGQIGDLAESAVKRRAGVKDSGIWPGLGGALDTLDSLLLAAPIGYYLRPL